MLINFMLDCLKCDTFSACQCSHLSKGHRQLCLKKNKKIKTNIGGFEQGFRF